jgi:hypothetical protein
MKLRWQAAVLLYGTSQIFTYNQRLSSPPATTDTYMDNFPGFVIMPEPGVGLLMIPALALLAWQYKRRRFISSRN